MRILGMEAGLRARPSARARNICIVVVVTVVLNDKNHSNWPTDSREFVTALFAERREVARDYKTAE